MQISRRRRKAIFCQSFGPADTPQTLEMAAAVRPLSISAIQKRRAGTHSGRALTRPLPPLNMDSQAQSGTVLRYDLSQKP